MMKRQWLVSGGIAATIMGLSVFAVPGHAARVVQIDLPPGGCLGTGLITIAVQSDPRRETGDNTEAPAASQPDAALNAPEKAVFHCESTHASALAVCQTSR